jgi:Skp family chaperone for outer membrane proteins
MKRNPQNDFPRRRQYIRLETVFPVSFRIFDAQNNSFLTKNLQGFTNNISLGGICLRVGDLSPQVADMLKEPQVQLSLNIELILLGKAINAFAKVIWVKDIAPKSGEYLIGLAYSRIDKAENLWLMRYLRLKKMLVPALLGALIILGLILGLSSFIGVKLIRANKALVEQLVMIVQESSVAKQKIKEIAKEKEKLDLEIQAMQSRILSLEQEVGAKEATEKQKDLIDELTRQKNTLQEQLVSLQQKEGLVTEELLRLDKKKSTLEKANFDKMYYWLKVHQNPRTGLVMSFEGDSGINGWAFIYDQALLVDAYSLFSDFQRSQKILDFFAKRAQKENGWFMNAYYASDGTPAEYTVHSGPNIWLGIAILQYTSRSKDKQYLGLAEDIADNIIKMQDAEGGISAGPNLSWYATEHNLDAFAFFNMLYEVTAKAHYQESAGRVFDWLKEHSYDSPDIPVKRGRGDATIATDTYAWAIAACGPERLELAGMNPDRILEFAQTYCAAEVDYLRPTGEVVKIKGFDFAPQRNIARGQVVSSEWTAQMVMAFKIMADFYDHKDMKAKAHAYAVKADEYMAQLGKMIISSPSPSGQGESCLAYATEEDIDTGHGWRTPRGKSTGSVAATAYTIFAYYNHNPLELE